MRSQTWTPLPPPSPQHLSGSSPCTSPKQAAPYIRHGLAIQFLHDSIHVMFCFSFCWIFVSVLEFPVLPTINHGKSKDGIQPFKGPKPAARIANSLANRVYWAACRAGIPLSPPPSPPCTMLPTWNHPTDCIPETNHQEPAVSFSEKQQKKLKPRATTPPRTQMKTNMTSYLAPRKEDLASIFNHLF